MHRRTTTASTKRHACFFEKLPATTDWSYHYRIRLSNHSHSILIYEVFRNIFFFLRLFLNYHYCYKRSEEITGIGFIKYLDLSWKPIFLEASELAVMKANKKLYCKPFKLHKTVQTAYSEGSPYTARNTELPFLSAEMPFLNDQHNKHLCKRWRREPEALL